MTIVRRERKDNFAIVPNVVANDERLTFAERGMLVYLLAKPHDWKVDVNNLRNVGGVGRDKVYAMINRLIETGYLKRVTTRGAGSRFAAHEYIVYDDPIPDQLPLAARCAVPLPENQDMEKPLPENQETAEPLPENPLADFPDPANQDAILKTKNTNTPQNPPSLFHEQDSNQRFATLIAEWPDDRKPPRLTKLLRRFTNLPADEQEAMVHNAARWRRWMVFKNRKPLLTTYFETAGWRILSDAPDFDTDGRFVLKPGTPYWDAWMRLIEAKYGAERRKSVEARKYFLVETPYPTEAEAA